MSVNNNNFSISDVNISNTFESWRVKTNDEIIEKLNLLKLYDVEITSATGGGITTDVAVAGGKLNIELNPIIQKGVTFLNVDVGFSGGVNINSNLLNLNRNATPAESMPTISGIVIGSSTGGFTADGGYAEAGQTFSLNGYTGPYWLNKDNFWFTEQNLRFDSWTGTQFKFGSSGSNNLLDICGPGQGYTTDAGMSYASGGLEKGIRENSIRVYNHKRDAVMSILDDGTMEINSGVNRKRITQTNHGLTFGHVVRFDGTNYIKSFAGATTGDGSDYDAKNAEVVGIVSRLMGLTHGGGAYGNTFDITFSGEVRGDFSDVVSGSELTAGCIYYLSTTGEGLLTNQQPSSVGLSYDKVVSKPVMYALGATAGLLLNYRGQLIKPDSATIATYTATGGVLGTADIYHTSRIAITNTHGFTSGDIISQVGTGVDSTGYTLASTTAIEGVDLARSVIGIATTEDTAANTINLVTSGLITGHDNVSFAGFNPGHHILGSSSRGGLSADNDNWGSEGFYKPIATIIDSNTAVVHIGGVQPARPVGGGGAAASNTSFGGGGGAGQNHLINGGFYYWRRGLATSSAHTGTADAYFADRWKRSSGFGAGGLGQYTPSGGGTGATYDFSIQRQTFSSGQSDVPGTPKYYADIKGTFATGATGSTYGYYSRVEQRLEGSDIFADNSGGRVMTLSLYNKSTVAGGTVGVSFIRCPDGSTETKTDIGEISPTTSWKRYINTFAAPTGSTSTSANAYSAIALYTTDQDRYGGGSTGHAGTLSLAQVKLEEGSGSFSYPEVDKQQELFKCERYYQTSYAADKYPGSNTMVSTVTPNMSSVDFMTPPDGRYVYRFPVKMRATPSVNIWSPSGKTAGAFNKTAKRDLRNAAGGSGLLGDRRASKPDKTALITSNVELGAEIHIVAGFAPLDVISFHYEADSEL
jgi:hypothetical protein